MPSRSEVISSGTSMKVEYPSVVAHGLDMTELYKGRLLQTYDDYVDDLMIPLDLGGYPEIPTRLLANSRGVFKRSNYRFGDVENWTAIEKDGHC